MSVRSAAERSFSAVSRRLVLLVTPLVIAGFVVRGFIWASHRELRGKWLGLEFVLLFAVCMPFGFFAETMVAAMYLRVRKGEPTGLRQGLEVRRYPGATGAIARLAAMFCLWFVPTTIVALIVSVVLKALVQVGKPGHHAGFSIARGDDWWLVVGLIFYAAWFSRYSLVLPRLAVRRGSSNEAFGAAVRQVKGYWGVLATVTGLLYLIEHFAGRLKFWPGLTHAERGVAVIADILVTAVAGAYVNGFLTEVALGSDPLSMAP